MDEIHELQMLHGSCAVCKHLHKRCDESCTLAQYFPAERTPNFQNVHKLFGIQNALKIVDSVEEDKREKTIETLIMEARIRLENPVHGSLAVQRKLRAEMEEAKKELNMIRKKRQFLRAKGEEAAPPQNEEADHP